MEWLLILNLMIEEIKDPPKVPYPTLQACEMAAESIAEQYDWISWVKSGDDASLTPPTFGPTVRCQEAVSD